MQKKEPVGHDRHSIRWGRELSRLMRLSAKTGKSPGDIARQAVIEYEIGQSLFRDTVRDAVLALVQACVPDGQYDPIEDPRQEEAVRHLGGLLNSMYAAEGIQSAFTLLLTQNPHILAELNVPVPPSEGKVTPQAVPWPVTHGTDGNQL